MAGRTAREAALAALLDRKGAVTTHLDRLLAAGNLGARDTALAHELVCGVTRRRRTLDTIIRAYSRRPRHAPPRLVQAVCRMAVYQLLFLDRVPAFAAVAEAVDACRRRHPRHAGFVNALCRAISRAAGEAVREAWRPAADIVPLEPDRCRRMDREVFASPTERPAEFVGESCSLPQELAERWLRRANTLDAACRAALENNARPPVVARVNSRLATVEGVLVELAGAGIEAVAHEDGRCVVFGGSADPARLEALRCGRITPQDATAAAVAPALKVSPGMRVLDFCAAPGTKTTHLGELMDNRGEIVAVDVTAEKLLRIEAAARRCRLDIVRTHPAARVGELAVGSFDRVLVNAPCSNTGVLARRVEARWRFIAADQHRLAVQQREILALAAMFLAPGGRLVYSTCSLEGEENEGVVHSFLTRHPTFSLVSERLTEPAGFVPPQRYRDGGYWAAMRRS